MAEPHKTTVYHDRMRSHTRFVQDNNLKLHLWFSCVQRHLTMENGCNIPVNQYSSERVARPLFRCRAFIACSISACFSIATKIFHRKLFCRALKTAKLFCLETVMVYGTSRYQAYTHHPYGIHECTKDNLVHDYA